tara:strand:- start:355 stop:744 length:390 start_codon:yes stop_codon:yes gene_type:complete
METYVETIKDDFVEYLRENWDDNQGPFDEWRDEYIHETYNTGTLGPFNEQYRDLVYFMGIIHAEDESADWFTAWNEPQKIYELGMYLLATETINGMEFDEINASSDDEPNYVAEPVIVEDEATIRGRQQ